jgi:uncharacterized protein with HEPN domain
MCALRRDASYLADIVEAIQRIAGYILGLDYDQFLDDVRTQDAVLRNLQVIGEATKKLSPELRQENPDLPWKAMAGLRDRIVHDYFGINSEVVWTVVSRELPPLLPQVAALLEETEH